MGRVRTQDYMSMYSVASQIPILSLIPTSLRGCWNETYLQHVLSVCRDPTVTDLSSSLVVGKPCLVIPAPVTEQSSYSQTGLW